MSPLHWAATEGRLRASAWLLGPGGADPEGRDNQVCTVEQTVCTVELTVWTVELTVWTEEQTVWTVEQTASLSVGVGCRFGDGIQPLAWIAWAAITRHGRTDDKHERWVSVSGISR